MNAPSPYRFDHLARMSDERGLFEHALRDVPRLEHGYCTDDNARLLVVTSREPDEGMPGYLGRLALRFLLSAQDEEGRIHNRMSHLDGLRWTDSASTGDWWGRAVWGLGVAAALHDHADIRAEAAWAFRLSARQRSPFLHSMAFASLGAAHMLAVEPEDDVARSLLISARELFDVRTVPDWPWPRARLTYANASIAEAMLATGTALQDDALHARGLDLLDWLLRLQQQDGHLSVVGTGGRGRTDSCPQFDQQPIEVAAIADACWLAWCRTGDERWAKGIELAASWFEGVNDVGCRMYRPTTGGGFDGLTARGPNLNQGAESTLAYISTMQRYAAIPLSARARDASQIAS